MNIPDIYAANETLSSAYRNGWNHGHGIACHNVPEISAKLFVEDMGRVTVDADNIREVHQSFVFRQNLIRANIRRLNFWRMN